MLKRTIALAFAACALTAPAATPTSSIVINELMASNAGVVMSPAFNFDSWIELYNPSEQVVNLAGMFLSDDNTNLTLWKLPDDIGIIPAKGFLVVWMGSDDILSNQAPFKLDCDGGTIYLSDRSGQLITSMQYPEALSRTAYARTTDGGSEWNWTANPTPGESNTTSVFAAERLAPPVVSQGSQLFTEPFTAKVDIPEGATLMYTTDNSVPERALQAEPGVVEEPYWRNWVRNGDCEGDDATSLICRDANGSGDIGRITDGVGVNGSRGAKVHSTETPENDWDAQFFIYTPDHVWQAGEQYHFRMKVRADKPSHISAQSHTTPGSYIHWQMLNGGYNITSEWQEFSYDGTITDQQAGTMGMQTIAFNLNEMAQENNFYFDDIVWESFFDPAEQGSGSAKPSKNGIFKVNKTTNYVFRLFRNGYLPSVPVTRSYILDEKNITVPIVSIVGDERYFTDPMWGIDVKGTNGIPGNGSDDPVNWNQPWDRPVNFSYISPTEGMLFNQDVNVSISGGWTRGASPRSMKLKSNKVFDGLNHLDYSFFPQKPYIRSKALLVRNGGNDVWEHHARFMDPALTTIIQRSGLDLDVQSHVQVAEYINGRLRGVLNLREPTNDKFVYANYGYDDEEIDMMENGHFNNGTSDAYKRLCELAADINSAGAYDEVKQLLDVDEFANYMAVELFLGNDDWPHNNAKAYRSQDNGRFRFICFDLDYSFYPWGTNSFTQVLDNHRDTKMVALFINLLQNDEFRRKFIDTFCIVAGSVFEKERASQIVDELADAMRPMSELDGYTPDNAVNKIKGKLETWLEEMTTRLQQYKPMKLSGTTKRNVALAADAEGANLFINGIKVPYAAFNGQLFPPVTLEAKAPAGYSFAGWHKTSTSLVQLINTNDVWKYYDKGQLGSSWHNLDYNDASWSSGTAPLGYNMAGVTTTISYGTDSQRKNPTTFFRKTFTINSTPTNNDYFQLNYQVDDGCVVWVNGQEAGRVNMPNGTIGYTTFSSTYAADTPLTGTLDLSPSLFREGKNVIAVEVHNTSYTSGDLFWACELVSSVGAHSDDVILEEPVIELPQANDILLTARFTPLTDAERQAQGLNPICINEVSAANDIYVNEYFKRNDWIELYNTTDSEIDVEGMYLSDNPLKPQKYQITKTDGITTIVPAHGFLIVWCDKLAPLAQLHTSFKLDADGGDVLLTAADQSWSDRLTYNTMKGDETVGRYPDGYQDVVTMNVPTIRKSNIASSYSNVVDQPEETGLSDLAADGTIGLSIRYLAGRLVLRSTTPIATAKMDICNLAGQKLWEQAVDLSSCHDELTLNMLPTGYYLARLTDGSGHTTTCKFIKK